MTIYRIQIQIEAGRVKTLNMEHLDYKTILVPNPFCGLNKCLRHLLDIIPKNNYFRAINDTPFILKGAHTYIHTHAHTN